LSRTEEKLDAGRLSLITAAIFFENFQPEAGTQPIAGERPQLTGDRSISV
jgi:hypothetical protein